MKHGSITFLFPPEDDAATMPCHMTANPHDTFHAMLMKVNPCRRFKVHGVDDMYITYLYIYILLKKYIYIYIL